MALTTINKTNHTFWLDHTAQWLSSGLSQSAYCKQHDLCRKRFNYHKQRSNLAEQKNNPSTEFVPVQLETSTTPCTPTMGLSLRLNESLCIEGITAHNLMLVQPLLAVL